MKFIRFLTVFTMAIAITSVAHADLIKTKWQFFISYSDMKKDKNYLVNFISQGKSGKVTCITISSQKLADYLESLNTDTVEITLDNKEKGRLDFVTIGSLPWRKLKMRVSRASGWDFHITLKTIQPNKALQLTPSRHELLSYHRFSFPSTSSRESTRYRGS